MNEAFRRPALSEYSEAEFSTLVASGDRLVATLRDDPVVTSVGWADVATKQDLAILEHSLRAEFEREIRTVVVTMMTLFTVGFLATIASTMVAVALR